MNREEAIEELKTRYLTMSQRLNKEELHKANKAIDMAITALSQEQQSEWERDHEILKAYADGQESMEGDKRNIEEIAEVMKCDADADTKCRMISNILNAKPHYFKSQEPCEKYIKEIDHLRKYIYKLETQIVEQEPCGDTISRQALKDLGAECIAKRDENGNLVPLGCINNLPSVSTERTDTYKQGWHDAITTALKETHNIRTDYGIFRVVQEETLIGVGMAYEPVSTEKTGRWIPVSEPPKEEGRYICDYGCCIDFGSYHDGHWYIQGAVAYMPLPQPYKEESEE